MARRPKGRNQTLSPKSKMQVVCGGKRMRISKESLYLTLGIFFLQLVQQEAWVGDIKEALKQMQPLKAPSLNSILTFFYQKYWHIGGKEVESLVLDILNNGKSSESLNKIFIYLILKCKTPRNPIEFRPISLCNVVMKIVTKCLVNRPKSLLPFLVDEE
ncbi:unnamed protein product [Vicia faba]|uniref:Uncharacterized protein n=1 Tax=Vicia faba TaxID=3906 RepID=A0AAV0YK84_VICFA|nr:unnamed protein product [Vicia faba]